MMNLLIGSVLYLVLCVLVLVGFFMYYHQKALPAYKSWKVFVGRVFERHSFSLSRDAISFLLGPIACVFIVVGYIISFIGDFFAELGERILYGW